MSKNYEVLNELVPKTKELHRAVFDKGYEQGKQDGLCKIREEIERQEKWLLQAGYNTYNIDIALDAIKSVVAESEDK
jgi:hypothetical protein